MSYYQAPNRTGEQLPGERPKYGGYEYSTLGHGPLCCVGNTSRVIPNYITSMWMATQDHGLAATLYGPCRLRTLVDGDVPVVLDRETKYPFESNRKRSRLTGR